MNNRTLATFARAPFTAFYTPSSTGSKVHVFKDGEFLYSLAAFIEVRKRGTALQFSFYLSKKLPASANWADFLDSEERYTSRNKAEAEADEKLYAAVAQFTKGD